MEESTYNTILIIVIVIVVTCIIGLNLVYLIDKKVSNIAVNIPPLPKPKVTIKFDHQRVQVFNDDDEDDEQKIKPTVRRKHYASSLGVEKCEDFSPNLEDLRETPHAESCTSQKNLEVTPYTLDKLKHRNWEIEDKFNQQTHIHKDGKEEDQNPQLASDNKPYTMQTPVLYRNKVPNTSCHGSGNINKTINEYDKKLKIKFYMTPANSNLIDYASVYDQEGGVYTKKKTLVETFANSSEFKSEKKKNKIKKRRS